MSKESEQMDSMTLQDIKANPCGFCWACKWQRLGDCYTGNPAQCSVCSVILLVILKAESAKSQTDNTELRKLRKEIAKCFYDEKIMESDHDDWDENSIEYFDTPIVITKIAKYIQAKLKQQDIKSRIDELEHMHTGGMWFADDGTAIRVSDRLTQLSNKEIINE